MLSIFLSYFYHCCAALYEQLLSSIIQHWLNRNSQLLLLITMHDSADILHLLTDILVVLQPENDKHLPLITRINSAIATMHPGNHIPANQIGDPPNKSSAHSHLSQQTQSSQINSQSNHHTHNLNLPLMDTIVESKQIVDSPHIIQNQPIFSSIVASVKYVQLFHNNSTIKDFFIFDYDRVQGKYKLIAQQANSNSEDRKVYCELFISNNQEHSHRIKRTNSMTAILKHTSNPPKILKPLILPNFHGQHDRYIYAFQTREMSKHNQEYLACDRLYCFIADRFMPQQLIALIKQMIKKKFELQLLLKGDKEAIKYEQQHKHLKQTVFDELLDMILQLEKDLSEKDEKEESMHQQQSWQNYIQEINWYEVPVRLNLLYDKSISISILLFFFAVKNYKIILISTKQNRYLQSVMVASLIHSLKPIKYVSPIILSTLTSQHFQFAHSPVPMILGFWANEKTTDRALQTIKQMIMDENKTHSKVEEQILKTVLIDVNNHKAFYNSLNSHDLTLLEKLTEYIANGDNKNIASSISILLKDIALSEVNSHQQWIEYLKKQIKRCQMFECYQNQKIQCK